MIAPKARGTGPLVAVLTLIASVATAQQGGVVTRMSVSSAGAEANSSSGGVAMSGDGRFVAFDSDATNLVPGDTNGNRDVFVHDTLTGVVERVSLTWNGMEARDDSRCPAISADGRMVAFMSQAWNMYPGGANLGSVRENVYVHDRQTGVTTWLTRAADGGEPDNRSGCPSISADGSRIVFASTARNLVRNDINNTDDVFLYDLDKQKLRIISRTADGNSGDASSYSPTISADGTVVGFISFARDLDGAPVAARPYSSAHAFVRDLATATTELIDVPAVQPQFADASSYEISLSADGRVVAFGSYASNLVPLFVSPGYTGNIFVRDRGAAKTVLASREDPMALGCTPSWATARCESGSSHHPALSADGRWLTFISYSQRLLPMSFTRAPQVYKFDVLGQRLRRISVDPTGWEGACSGGGAISDDGSVTAFVNDGGLVPEQNASRDVYRQELRRTADGRTSPVAACPLKPAGCAPAVGSVFRLRKHAPGGVNADRVFWRWQGDPQSAPLPDPTAGARYQLCVYTADGRVALDVGTPAAGSCPAGDAACWQKTGKQQKLRDPKGALSALTVAGGSVSRILVRGQGPLIDAPFLPLVGVGLTVQLQDATSGRCWTADFPGSAVKKNFAGTPGDGSRRDGSLLAELR